MTNALAEPTRVLMEGTIKYLGSKEGNGACDWITARVFVLDWRPPSGWGSEGEAAVIAREPIYLPRYRPGAAPSPVGSIHKVPVFDASKDGYIGQGNLLTVEAEPVA